MSKITEKMQVLYEKILAGKPAGDRQLAHYLQKLALAAIKAGINSREWKEYMACFASNQQQFERLIGRDEAFNRTSYGMGVLAYMVADSTCGSTTDTWVGRLMTKEMRDGLDSGLPTKDEPIEGFEAGAAKIDTLLTEEFFTANK